MNSISPCRKISNNSPATHCMACFGVMKAKQQRHQRYVAAKACGVLSNKVSPFNSDRQPTSLATDLLFVWPWDFLLSTDYGELVYFLYRRFHSTSLCFLEMTFPTNAGNYLTAIFTVLSDSFSKLYDPQS